MSPASADVTAIAVAHDAIDAFDVEPAPGPTSSVLDSALDQGLAGLAGPAGPAGPVTRVEILDVLDDAFEAGPAARSRLVTVARRSRARADLVTLLERLPDRTYANQRQLWVDLPHVPVGL